MPIVILLDVSLSMLRNVDDSTNKEISRKKMAVNGLIYFLEKLSILKLEFVSLVYFAEDAEIIADFTKDYQNLIDILKNKCDLKTKTDFLKAFRLVLTHCPFIWGGNTKCHCVIITDSNGLEENLRNSIDKFDENLLTLLKRSNVSFEFCFLNRRPIDDDKFFSDLISKNSGGGHLYYINDFETKGKNDENLKYLFDFIYDSHLAPLKSRLRCGSLISNVLVFPKVDVYSSEKDFQSIERRISEEQIQILGFLKPTELANPPILSKHLILASPGQYSDPIKEEKHPNLCVLLHGSIKIEDSVALCNLGHDWFGYIYCLADSKRSNLILQCFYPGVDSVPWLGNLDHFTLKSSITSMSKTIQPSKAKPSYATTNPSWIQNYGLQSDLQKIVRYTKKLPDKETVFYQELNRVINHAMSLGCIDLLIIFLEKEKSNSASNSSQAKHLSYVTKMLSSPNLKYGEPLLPMFK